jgi:hypothetical protein
MTCFRLASKLGIQTADARFSGWMGSLLNGDFSIYSLPHKKLSPEYFLLEPGMR